MCIRDRLKRPIFFGENLMGRENPHNRIKPTLSTQIIISHAKDGLELAKEYKLPEVIQDIIIQHHGTTLVKYFYYTLKNSLTAAPSGLMTLKRILQSFAIMRSVPCG